MVAVCRGAEAEPLVDAGIGQPGLTFLCMAPGYLGPQQEGHPEKGIQLS